MKISSKGVSKRAGLGLLLLLAGGCASYPMAENVKMISFEDNITEGKSVGPIEGADCKWSILGRDFGGEPTISRALANARTQSGGGLMDSIKGSSDSLNDKSVRYINNVSSTWDGFNAGVIGKRCLVVKGTGYR